MIAVVGATAAGKSDLAVELALRLGGEAVNADSMQLYRGMDIGTAKLSRAEMRGVRHHLLDVWDVTVTANVAEYQRLGADAIADIRGRGRLPILVGGSGLYVRAALDELEFPGTDPAVRARLDGELAEVGPGALHERLRGVDPAAAAAILPSNGRRIVRALEVIEITGRPFTASLPEYRYRYGAVTQIGLSVPRDELDERIAARVRRMWDAGLVDEVRELEKHGLRDGLTAGRALGYAQVLRFLSGECTQEEARDDTVRTTRRFARRQESWFRRDPRVQWLPSDTSDLVERALALAGRGAGPGN
ncbi:tRNA (adenosine(37)-N6)-dimethylallyltransferase MiaA [Actinomadura spongiicola]|uniref:tRNA dimethylallyltransferase n=1 Tax=Actinomadura spongiicola TaxID=2303421 RepID=A0A372GJS2_9ACTN|nr:tRNA (adenosine(37)-N6)-dimethylallyltransferase MiaA [Actinomadura spongiicola]RFS85624.1 tRNA (adenosine(37)-N6)-dimethylallyltransferase MiaA [Actinomadura spongiicola]